MTLSRAQSDTPYGKSLTAEDTPADPDGAHSGSSALLAAEQLVEQGRIILNTRH